MSLVQRLRVAIFAVLAVASVVFAGVEYVGIPQRYLGQSYVVSVNLPESGGIFANAEVTMRGVAVGRVRSLHLTPDGVRADLRIEKGIDIPTNTLVRISNLSAVGEQYVNLMPPQEGGPFLSAGDALPIGAASTPLRVTALLVHLDRLATSIGKADLHTVVTELGAAFDRSGRDLQTVLDQARVVTGTLAAAQPRTTRLINDGGTVLATQDDLSVPLQRFSQGLDTLTATIAGADPEIREILDQGPQTLAATRRLLDTNKADVGVLLGNLLTVSEIVAEPVRLRALNTQLVLLPRIVQGTFRIQPGDGYARLGAVLDTSMAVCTRGYESSGSPPVQGSRLSQVPGNPEFRANLNAYCAEKPSSGIGVRGAANVPRPPGDSTATVIPQSNPRGFGPGSSFSNDGAPSAAGAAGADSAAGAAAPTPDSSDAAVDGRLAGEPGQTRMLGPTSLRDLLLRSLG